MAILQSWISVIISLKNFVCGKLNQLWRHTTAPNLSLLKASKNRQLFLNGFWHETLIWRNKHHSSLQLYICNWFIMYLVFQWIFHFHAQEFQKSELNRVVDMMSISMVISYWLLFYWSNLQSFSVHGWFVAGPIRYIFNFAKRPMIWIFCRKKSCGVVRLSFYWQWW